MTKKELEEMRAWGEENSFLKSENRKLNIKVASLEGDVYVKAEDYKKIAIENKKLKEENEILKEYKSMYEGLIIN